MDLKREETAGEKQGGKALLFMDEFLSQADVIVSVEIMLNRGFCESFADSTLDTCGALL